MMIPELVEALQNAFINIANTPKGQEVISIYGHKGYEIGDSKTMKMKKSSTFNIVYAIIENKEFMIDIMNSFCV